MRGDVDGDGREGDAGGGVGVGREGRGGEGREECDVGGPPGVFGCRGSWRGPEVFSGERTG